MNIITGMTLVLKISLLYTEIKKFTYLVQVGLVYTVRVHDASYHENCIYDLKYLLKTN